MKTVPVDLSQLSNVVNNDVVEKTVYQKLVTKVNNINTTGFVLKTKYDTDKSDLEKKISAAEKKFSDTSGLVKKTDYNSKITEIESRISSISDLVTNSAFSNLVLRTDYNTKISEIENKVSDHDHDKYITTSEFNQLTAENFKARLAQANLVTKKDFDAKLTSPNKKLIQINIYLLKINLKNYKHLTQVV